MFLANPRLPNWPFGDSEIASGCRWPDHQTPYLQLLSVLGTNTQGKNWFLLYCARDGEGKHVLRLPTYCAKLCRFFLFNFCWIWAWTKTLALQHFPCTLIQRSNAHEAGSCGGLSLCSQRFAWLLPFTISSASKKNWCYLLKRKLNIVFAAEDFLCAYPQPVQWWQGVASHSCASSESLKNSLCAEAKEIPSYWCLWSQIKVNLSSRERDWKRYLTSSFTFSSLPWNDLLYLLGYAFHLSTYGFHFSSSE